MRSPFLVRSPKLGWWIHLIPAVVLAGVLLGDQFFPQARMINPLLLLALAAFSFVFPPRVILIWTLFYTVPVAMSVVSLAGAVSLPTGAALLRVAAFAAAGVMGAMISAYRINLSAEAANYIKLFDALPIPLVISDIDGEIQFANEASCQLLQRPLDQVVSLNYFSLFSDPQNRGGEIARYLELFDDEKSLTNVMLVVQSKEGSLQRLAACFVANIQGRPYLVTQMGTIVI